MLRLFGGEDLQKLCSEGSNLISRHSPAKLMRQRTEIRGGFFRLFGAGGGLLAGHSNIPERVNHLLETDLLLAAASYNLLEGAHAFLDIVGQFSNGLIGDAGLLAPGIGPFHRFFGQHHGRCNALLNVAQNGAHLYGRLLGLRRQILHLAGYHRKTAAVSPAAAA